MKNNTIEEMLKKDFARYVTHKKAPLNKFVATRDGKLFRHYKFTGWKEVKPQQSGKTLFYYLSSNYNTKREKCAVIMADTFIENPKKYKKVFHKNKNFKDIRVENLEWCKRNQSAEQRRRAETMLVLHQQGKTLQQIGDKFGLCRERVRQIIAEVDDYDIDIKTIAKRDGWIGALARQVLELQEKQ